MNHLFYINRSRAWNAFHILLICADMLDKYFTNRFLNAAFDKQKKICLLTSSIPANDIKVYKPPFSTEEEGLYLVRSQSFVDTWYLLDLNAGVCQCIDGSNGKICKHQRAVYIHLEIECSRVFKGTQKERHSLAVLAYGPTKKCPSIDFFAPITQVDVPSTSVQQAEMVATDLATTPESGSSIPDHGQMPPTSCPLDDTEENVPQDHTEENIALCEEVAAMLKRRLDMKSPASTKVLQTFIDRGDQIKVPAVMVQQLYGFNRVAFNTTSGKKIKVQNSGIRRRRTGCPKGANPLPKGRKKKRPHSLVQAVNDNTANAKKH